MGTVQVLTYKKVLTNMKNASACDVFSLSETEYRIPKLIVPESWSLEIPAPCILALTKAE